MEKYICEYCGKEFERGGKRHQHVFCSLSCFHKYNVGARWNPNKIVKTTKQICLNCGKDFETAVRPSTKRKFCSLDCSYKYHSGKGNYLWKVRTKVNCKYCGKQFDSLNNAWSALYCSRSCFNKWYSENKSGKNSHRWKQIKVTCKECGKDFTTYPARVYKQNRGKFCSKKCQAIWRSNNIYGVNHPSWIDGRSFVPYCQKFNNQLKEMVRKRDNRVCQLCSLSELDNGKKLDVHHIHYDKQNCYPDLLALCYKCNIVVNNRLLRSGYEQRFMNNLNDRGLLFWTRNSIPS